LLGAVVAEVRSCIIAKRYTETELDTVVAFHDDAEALWQSTVATNPPIAVNALLTRLERLLDTCRTPVLAEFEHRIGRGLRDAEALEEVKKAK
jgi:hypothetical protein